MFLSKKNIYINIPDAPDLFIYFYLFIIIIVYPKVFNPMFFLVNN